MSSFANLMKVAEAITRSSNQEALEAAKRKEAALLQAREEAERERQRQRILQRVEEARKQEDNVMRGKLDETKKEYQGMSTSYFPSYRGSEEEENDLKRQQKRGEIPDGLLAKHGAAEEHESQPTYLARDVDSDDDLEVTRYELEQEELRSARITEREDAMAEAEEKHSEEERRCPKRKPGAGGRHLPDEDLGGNTRDLIWQLMGKNRTDYMARDVDSDDDLEVTGYELEEEERRSARMSKLDDAIEEAEERRREEEKRRRKAERSARK